MEEDDGSYEEVYDEVDYEEDETGYEEWYAEQNEVQQEDSSLDEDGADGSDPKYIYIGAGSAGHHEEPGNPAVGCGCVLLIILFCVFACSL